MIRIVLAFILAPLIGMLAGLFVLATYWEEDIVSYVLSLEGVFCTTITYVAVGAVGFPGFFVLRRKQIFSLAASIIIALGCVALAALILAWAAQPKLNLVLQNLVALGSAGFFSGLTGGTLFWFLGFRSNQALTSGST